MKDYFQFIRDLHERLGIYDNPNAFYAPETETAEERLRRHVRHDRTPKSPAMQKAATAVMKRIRARERAERNKRPPYPWGNKASVAGWWHPKMENYTFLHKNGYHVTQLVMNPSRFGISKSEMYEGLLREAQYYVSRGIGYWTEDGSDELQYTPEIVKARIKSEDMDLAYEVQRVAYMKGWLKVYSGGSGSSGKPSLEGISRDSIKSALREMLAVRPELIDTDGIVEIDEIGLVRNQEKYNRLRGAEITRYLNS